MYYYLGILVISLAFFIGLYVGKRITKASKVQKSKNLYSGAFSAFINRNYEFALAQLGEATGNWKHPQIYNLMGHVYEKLNLHELEAMSFFDAHREIFQNFSFTGSTSYPQDITYFFYRESLAHSRTNNWEFTYIRADTALKMIRRREAPALVDGVDYEQELVALRMISALSHLKVPEDFELIRADAEWLLERSTKQLLKDLAKAILDISDKVSEISPDPFLSMWSIYISNNGGNGHLSNSLQ